MDWRIARSLLTGVGKIGIIAAVFRSSAAVAQLAVNQLVAGSNPASGAKHKHFE